MRKSLITMSAFVGITVLSNSLHASDQIIHDADYYILEVQNSEQWAG
jgi:hypothetical protein